MRRIFVGFVVISALAAAPVLAQEDAEGCKDHPLFTRFTGMYLAGCESSQFDLRKFPVGLPGKDDPTLRSVDVEGPTQWLSYNLKEGATPPSGLQIMRNFENATKKAGGTVEGQWPGWCKAMYDGEDMDAFFKRNSGN